MTPEKGKVQFLINCRCCGKREILAENVFTSYQRTVKLILEKFDKLLLLNHQELSEHGCNNVAVFDLVAVSQRHPEDPE